MVLTPSSMVPLGTPAPDFTLLNPTDGNTHSLSELKGSKVTVVLFICNHCPFVIHIREALKSLASEYDPEEVSFIAINANDIENYPDDAPELMGDEGYTFPYLYDESQEVAKAYDAKCTPDIFVYNGDLELTYRGQFDDSRPGKREATGEDLKNAIESTISGNKITEQKPSMGCNVKWK